VPVKREPGIEARVFSGRSGNVEAIPKVSNYVPVTMLDARLDGDEGTSFTQEIPPEEEGFVYVVSGQGYFSSNDTLVTTGQVGHLTHTSTTDRPTILNVSAKQPMRFLLWTGKPLRQPIVARGPFVMNTESQIAEAFADYTAGLFGPIHA